MTKTEELKETLDKVFQLISAVKVSGDAVDAVFSARQELRKAYQLVDNLDSATDESEASADGGQRNR
jgi:predicted S18 family serine protease